MAVTKLGNTKSASASINYFEKKAEIKSGLHCDVEIAKEQFRTTRKIFGKNDGVQAHTIIQSFRPNEVTAEQANAIGLELADKIAGSKGFEIAVYTHTDKEHIHNHIIINSVNFKTGKKYQSNSDTLRAIKKINDEICLSYGLSIANEKPAQIRYTLAEQSILQKGGDSWKDEIRMAINLVCSQAKSYDQFKITLETQYGIVVNDDENQEHITFTHPDNGRKVRGYRLGDDYTGEGIKNVIKKQIRARYIPDSIITSHEPRKQGASGEQLPQRSLGDVERTMRDVADGIKRLTSEGRREQTERERRLQKVIERDNRQHKPDE